MPVKRKLTYRRRSFNKRRRTYKRRPRGIRSRYIHKFRRMGSTTSFLSVQNAAESPSDLTIRLSDVAGAAEITALYDQYKFDKVVCKYTPNYTEASWLVGATNNALTSVPRPLIYCVNDFDGGGPSTIAAAREYGNVRTRDPFRPFKFVIKPALRPTVDNGGAPSIMPMVRSPWIDMSYPSVVFNGMTFLLPATAMVTTTTTIGRIELIYYFSCKNTR